MLPRRGRVSAVRTGRPTQVWPVFCCSGACHPDAETGMTRAERIEQARRDCKARLRTISPTRHRAIASLADAAGAVVKRTELIEYRADRVVRLVDRLLGAA
jgi:hypothetical protein